MKIYSRKEWGCPPSDLTQQFVASSSFVLIHHSVFRGMGVDTLAEMKTAMRQIDAEHRAQGWEMLGYSYVVFQPKGRMRRARVFEGRGFDHVPAAQLGHNTGNGAICVVGDFRKDKLRLSTRWRVARMARRFKGSRLGGHYQVTATECPGPNIKSQLNTIAKLAGKKRL